MSDCEAETERPDTLARSALALLRPELFWGGRSVSAVTGETFDVSNPSDGKHLIRVAAAGPENIDPAVQAAHQQFEQGHWPRMSGAERGEQLLRLANLIERDQFKLAALETNAMRIAREEIFGPVGTVIPFACEDEGVAIANDTSSGLNAGIFTHAVSRMHRVARELRAGAIRVSGWAFIDPRLPWGGIKASGYGCENGHAGIEDVSYEKVV